MHSLTEFRQIEEAQRELDLDFYGNVAATTLLVIIAMALFFSIGDGMEKEIKFRRDLWEVRCATQEIDPKYCVDVKQ